MDYVRAGSNPAVGTLYLVKIQSPLLLHLTISFFSNSIIPSKNQQCANCIEALSMPNYKGEGLSKQKRVPIS